MQINNHIHHGDATHFYHADGIVPQLLLAIPFVFVVIMYILATVVSNRRHKQWPIYRTFFWGFGVLCVCAAVVGPLANRAHIDFTAHMFGHLLLGMLAPLFMVLAAPMTLFLRALNVMLARRLSRVLRSWLGQVISNPIFSSFLNVGGLWILYTTDLYSSMQQSILLHVLIHIHIFLAGYLFTMSIIYIDPIPHRYSFVFRAIVLVIALAGHGILSKYIYVQPPNSVPVAQSEFGGMIMYYGGDAIEIVLIFILCFQWYRATRTRSSLRIGQC